MKENNTNTHNSMRRCDNFLIFNTCKQCDSTWVVVKMLGSCDCNENHRRYPIRWQAVISMNWNFNELSLNFVFDYIIFLLLVTFITNLFRVSTSRLLGKKNQQYSLQNWVWCRFKRFTVLSVPHSEVVVLFYRVFLRHRPVVVDSFVKYMEANIKTPLVPEIIWNRANGSAA